MFFRDARKVFGCRALCRARHPQFTLRGAAISAKQRATLRTELKYDPTRTDGDFTSFGILPFIQKNINDLLLSKDTPYQDGRPVANVGPTQDQRSLLSVLGSDFSGVFRGDQNSGRSFSVATYALNHALSRVPRYRLLQFHSTVDSIILVPTAELVLQYREYFNSLIKNLPVNCCPEKLVPKEGEEYEVEFRPLKIEFRLPDSSSLYLNSAFSESESDQTPQIIVTTPHQLKQMLTSERSKEVSEAKFVCVDEITALLSSTDISHNSTLEQTGKKKKYVSTIEVCVKKLQSIQFGTFQKEVEERLKRTERIAKKDAERYEGANMKENTFNHASFIVNSTNNVSISNIESLVRKQFPKYSSSKEEPNISLLKRLIKEKRKVLYKPIQFAFICDKIPSNYAFSNLATANERSFAITNAINAHERSAQFVRSVEERMHSTYTKYLQTKRDKDMQRFEDPITYFIEKMAKFSNDMRQIRKHERRLVNVGSGAVETIACANDNLEYRFIEVSRSPTKKNRTVITDINVAELYPLPSETQTLIMRKLENEMFNLDNCQKNFLKSFQPSNVTSVLIKTTMKEHLELEQGKGKGALLVVPARTNIPELIAQLNEGNQKHKYVHYNSTESSESYQKLRDHFINEETSVSNLIVTCDQLLGHKYKGCDNMIVFGLESIYPQLAYSSGENKGVSGLESVNGDLMMSMMNLLNSEETTKKQFTFVLNHISKSLSEEKRRSDYGKLAEVMIFNDIPRSIKTTKMTSAKTPEHVLSYDEF